MKIGGKRLLPEPGKKIVLGLIALGILAAVYIFQRYNPFGPNVNPNVVFIVNRTMRLIFNDFACFILVYVFFEQKKYLKLSFLVFLAELFIILPLYFVLKLTIEGPTEISSPLLSQLHRLIVNPTLMILLIAGFFYQRFVANKSKPHIH